MWFCCASAWPANAIVSSARTTKRRRIMVSPCRSHIELEQHHVAVLDDVLLAFHAVEPLLAGGGDRAAAQEIIVGDGLGLDEAALEIRMDHAGGFRRGVARVNRPRAHFLLARREVGAQA